VKYKVAVCHCVVAFVCVQFSGAWFSCIPCHSGSKRAGGLRAQSCY